jgi:hypothetical protein
MSSGEWTQGYVAEVGYTYGYYNELNPLRAALPLLRSGWAIPQVQAACEQGFGQGVSIAMHAAGQPVDWWGTDFNPQQAVFARYLAQASGSEAHLFDDAFEDFAKRPDLPEFDFIALHGIWSWISDANRRTIVDLVRRKLRLGGVLYVSYNTLPGWSHFAPMRHLMTRHAELMGRAGEGVIARVGGALDFAEKMLALEPNYAKVNTAVKDRFKLLKNQDRSYLAHEYFNRDWHPMYFADMAEWLAPAKLSYACSAHFTEHVDAVNLTADQRQLLADIPDPLFRQTTRDFLVNQQFRRDYWVKGARRLNPAEQQQAMKEQSVVLMTPPGKVPLKVSGHAGEAAMAPEVYGPLLDALGGHQPTTLGALEKRMASTKDINFAKLSQAMMILIGMGHVAPANAPQAVAQATPRAERLNRQLRERAKLADDIQFNLSPVTAGGVPVARFEQVFLLGLEEGRKAQANDLADYGWLILSSLNQRLRKDGEIIQDPEENLKALRATAAEFLERLPALRALGLAKN